MTKLYLNYGQENKETQYIKYVFQKYIGLLQQKVYTVIRCFLGVKLLLFIWHYPARRFDMYKTKSRDIQGKMPSLRVIWNVF